MPVGALAELGGGDRALLDLLGEDQVALGEDLLVAVALAEDECRGGAAQPVIDGAR